jgi:hypothetical protein
MSDVCLVFISTGLVHEIGASRAAIAARKLWCTTGGANLINTNESDRKLLSNPTRSRAAGNVFYGLARRLHLAARPGDALAVQGASLERG